MRLNRFYVTPNFELTDSLWIDDPGLVNQLQKVLRMKAGDELILFDGIKRDRLYRITLIEKNAVKLTHVTDFDRILPYREIYLLWSILKKDNNDHVLQKCTELGVSHFWPIVTERSVKKGLNTDRAKKIVIEASEQCGRSNIPSVREPDTIEHVLKSLEGKVSTVYFLEQGKKSFDNLEKAIAVMIGPEGGWSKSDIEKIHNFNSSQLEIISVGLGRFTLRAETAAVAAISQTIAIE